MRGHVDSDAQINQGHAADHNGELTEAYATAELAILFGYRARLVLATHYYSTLLLFVLFYATREIFILSSSKDALLGQMSAFCRVKNRGSLLLVCFFSQ